MNTKGIRHLIFFLVRNPNDFDYHLTGIDFTLNLNGKRLARGLGSKEVTIPRLGDAVMTVETTTSTLDIVRQLLEFSQKQDLTYDIKGVLHSTDGDCRLPMQVRSSSLACSLAHRQVLTQLHDNAPKSRKGNRPLKFRLCLKQLNRD